MRPDESAVEHASAKPLLHWHIMATHFPISAFLGAFLFMSLHVLTENDCFSLAAWVSLVSGALVMLPTGLTGLLEWRGAYKAKLTKAFLGKIWVGFAMMVLSAGLVTYQSLRPLDARGPYHMESHTLYLAVDTLLMIGAVLEGHWGGRLHHR